MDEQEEHQLSDNLIKEIGNFLEAVPASRLSKGLRVMFIAYVRSEMKTGFQGFFEDFVRDIDLLFDLLDLIEGGDKSTSIKDKRE